MEGWFHGQTTALWRRCVWAGLLFFLLAAFPGRPELVKKEATRDTHGLLVPLPVAGDEARRRNSDTLLERHGRDTDSDSLLSGSGSVDLTPAESPTVPISTPTIPAFTPAVFIEITLKISLEDFVREQETIEKRVLQVLLDFLPTALADRKRVASGSHSIVLQLDSEKSSNQLSVLRAYVADQDSGEQSVQATADLFDALASNRTTFLEQLHSAINIDVLDVRFIEDDPSTETPLKDSSLRWWDILVIALGCLAAASCPLLLALAFCCRWFTRRREDEEKEGLLTRDTQLDDHPPQTAGAAHTDQPRAATGGSGDLRERANGGGRDSDWERRDHARQVARVGFQSRVQVQSRPLTPDEIETLLQNPATLRREYSSIPSNLVTMADVPPGAEEKNRYKDILPNPQTRVSLFLKFAVANSDYINANFVRGLQECERTYIAAQGPLPWTVDDFWRMVWEQKTSIIVMVTGLQERRIMKCAQYWPDPQVTLTATYGDLNVTLKKRETSNPHYTITHFHVTHKEKLVSRDVTHCWFTAWPDHGVPSSTDPALEFLAHVRGHTHEIPAPIVVHCSAGIGRTGVFIGADMGMTQLEREGQVDILKIVSTMRQDRGGMVQTEKQYIFLHQLLLRYAHQLAESSLSVNGAAPSTLSAGDAPSSS